MPPLCSDIKQFSYRDILVKEADNGALLDANGSLSGTKVTQLEMCKNLVEITGARVDKVIDTVTRAPAKVLKMDSQIGDIKVGLSASFSIFSNHFEPVASYLDGEKLI